MPWQGLGGFRDPALLMIKDGCKSCKRSFCDAPSLIQPAFHPFSPSEYGDFVACCGEVVVFNGDSVHDYGDKGYQSFKLVDQSCHSLYSIEVSILIGSVNDFGGM